jgi:hypothetical protein
MSKEIHSQDLAFKDVWSEMDEIEPLTPFIADKSKEYNEFEAFREDALRAYREAALSDSYMFGEYDGYQAYKGDE